MIESRHAALIMIDMQNGFIDEKSSLCIAGAAATVPACARALAVARAQGIMIIHAIRSYESDGSNVERTRYSIWKQDKALSPLAQPYCSADIPVELKPLPNEVVMIKPRFSAFFGTRLAEMLHQNDISTVILTGTTTPNCIRSSCYDALSHDFNVVVLEDATSSRTEEVQRANLEDMEYIGATLMSCEEFENQGLSCVEDIAQQVHDEINQLLRPASAYIDLPIQNQGGNTLEA